MKNNILDIPGIKVGHAQDQDALTGCTVLICSKGATGGVDQRGGAPGTRETDLLRPMHLVNNVHAIVLTGGSAFGLNAAGGVMRYLAEQKFGYNTGDALVPIVPAAVLYDLSIGDSNVYPDEQMGYQACLNANDTSLPLGCIGAGTGATAGKILGVSQAMKSGIGSASIDLGNGVFVGALVAANPFGDILEPQNREILAGTRSLKKGPIKIGFDNYFADTKEVMRTFAGKSIMTLAQRNNTVIGIVATNAKLSKEEINKVSQMAHNGIAMSIQPAHTMLDGDTIFSIATNEKKCDVNIVGAYAADAVALAIKNAAITATPIANLPTANQKILE